MDYFNIETTYQTMTGYMFALISIVLMISIIYELINDGNIFSPIKRSLNAYILCAVILPVLNFTINTSFAISDGILDSLGDSKSLGLILEPEEFYDVVINQNRDRNSSSNEDESINDKRPFWEKKPEDVQVFGTSDKQAAILGGSLKDIPNAIFSYIAVAWVWACFILLQISYYLLYFFTGGLFAIPAILSIFPMFNSSITGAFKSIGTLFITPIVVSVILALLSLKVGTLTETGTIAESMKNVVIVIVLCTALGASIKLASGFLEATGLAGSLGTVGATASSMAGGMLMGGIGKIVANKGAIMSAGIAGLSGLTSFAKNPSNFTRNATSMAMSGIGNAIKRKSNSEGVMGKTAKALTTTADKFSATKNNANEKVASVKNVISDKLNNPTNTSGRMIATAKAMLNNPDEFRKKHEALKGIKEIGAKSSFKPHGYSHPSINQINQKTPEVTNASKPTQPRGFGLWADNKRSVPTVSISEKKNSKPPRDKNPKEQYKRNKSSYSLKNFNQNKQYSVNRILKKETYTHDEKWFNEQPKPLQNGIMKKYNIPYGTKPVQGVTYYP